MHAHAVHADVRLDADVSSWPLVLVALSPKACALAQPRVLRPASQERDHHQEAATRRCGSKYVSSEICTGVAAEAAIPSRTPRASS